MAHHSGDQPDDSSRQSEDPERGNRLPISRRTVMQTAAATGTAATLGGLASARSRQAETFELDGFTVGWEGRAPDDIADETNPTLELEVGETYVVEWTNADGAPHDFVILDAEDQRIVGTDITGEEGETLTLEFEATEEMAQYYCSVHPATMRGDIELVGVDDPPEPEDVTLIDPGPTIGLETVAEGLASPIDFQVANEETDRRFVADQPGQIYVHDEDGLQDEPFLDIADRIPELGLENGAGFDERGLLGLEFHPDFEENGRFFVRYSGERGTVTPGNWSHTFVVSEFQADDDLQSADPDSERRLMEIPQPQFNHNAGPLKFGPDGYLYIAVGDGGGADDTGPGHVRDWYDENEGGNGQNVTETLLGGMLRIDVDNEENGKPYAIPDDNPFAADVPVDPDEEATVSVSSHPTLGDILVDSEGRTLYMFDQDEQGANESTCQDDCAEAWPPLTTEEDPVAAETVEAELTTFEREDGATQVAADGWPLYYFADDEEPGQTNGQGVNDVWWVLRPDGSPFREEAVQDDEPMVPDIDGIAEYWAWGMRNPWGMSFTEDGQLLAADVGQLLFEIVNHVERGGNYGWNVREGTHCFSTENPGQPPEECPDERPEEFGGGERLLDPVIEYPQEYGVQNLGSAIVAGHMYTRDDVADLQGNYVFADWSNQFAEPQARLFVAYPPDDWPEEDEVENSLADQTDADLENYQEELWENVWAIDELLVDADDDLLREQEEDEDGRRLARYVLAIGRDGDGNQYILTSERAEPFGDTGEVHRIVPVDDEEEDEDGEEDDEEDEDEEENE